MEKKSTKTLKPLSSQLPRASAGLNLCHENCEEVWKQRPSLDFLQIHPEHLIQEKGGTYRDHLDELRHSYPILLHGFGLSIGSCAPLDLNYLKLVRTILDEHPEAFFSDHVSWSSLSHHHFHDLLPLIQTEETLSYVVERVEKCQEIIGQPLVIENISSYIRYRQSTMTESEFINELCNRSGCFVLLDINNLWANAINFGDDPLKIMHEYNKENIRSYHLAGCTKQKTKTGYALIDYHGEAVHEEVWILYKEALRHFGPWPTLLEWENNVPPLARTLEEAQKITKCLEEVKAS